MRIVCLLTALLLAGVGFVPVSDVGWLYPHPIITAFVNGACLVSAMLCACLAFQSDD
jgi:hypothetical protein